MLFKKRVVVNIQGKYFSIIDIIASLPANTALVCQEAYQLANNDFLLSQVGGNTLPAFIDFPNVVRRGCYDKGDSIIGDSFQKSARVTLMKRHNIVVVIT